MTGNEDGKTTHRGATLLRERAVAGVRDIKEFARAGEGGTALPPKAPGIDDAESVLREVFGYESFRPRQKEIIQNVLARRDTLAVLPTGGGKSLCYEIPALLQGGITIVISPLIALMQDQKEQLERAGIGCACITSGTDRASFETCLEELRENRIKLVYMAPEGLAGRRAARLFNEDGLRVSLVAVDEAHCISEWGYDFRPDYRRIADLRWRFPSAVFLALTASATEIVRKDILQNLMMDGAKVIVDSFNRKNIFLRVEKKTNGPLQLFRFINSRPGLSGIVYCFSRKQVDALERILCVCGVNVTKYHAGLTAEERCENQRRFIEDGALVMVATTAFGMGINKGNVRYVVHYDIPSSPEQYYQEVGRAGRDGEESEALLLYSERDAAWTQSLAEANDQEREDDPEPQASETTRRGLFSKKTKQNAKKEASLRTPAAIRFQAMRNYAEGRGCRRQTLLAYFGEAYSPRRHRGERCCDICERKGRRAKKGSGAVV